MTPRISLPILALLLAPVAIPAASAAEGGSCVSSFDCSTATMLFDFPFGVKTTATEAPSSRASRMYFGGVEERTVDLAPSSQRRRTFASDHAANNSSTGTAKVRDFDI